MSPTLLVVAAWIAGVPWGPLSTEPEREVVPLPPALESTQASLAPDAVYAGERVLLALGPAADHGAQASCEALGWDAVPLPVDRSSGEAQVHLTVPADALPGVYVVELRPTAGGADGILAWLDLVVLADG